LTWGGGKVKIEQYGISKRAAASARPVQEKPRRMKYERVARLDV